jgi:glycosyltransferase involved in cell wall biosynthesis
MQIVHLTSSRFFGGPERQMLGLAQALSERVQTSFLSFSERGMCSAFLDRVRDAGFEAEPLRHDTPHFGAAVRELAKILVQKNASVLCCHGYKAILLGRLAARRANVPAIAVSRGWTAETARVRIYETIERVSLRLMDRVVCVSQGQASKVLRAGVPAHQVVVIPNAISAARFESPEFGAFHNLHALFAQPMRRIVGAAGRLSPEKGFSVFVDAAATIARRDPTIGFVLFGDGPLRDSLAQQIAACGLERNFVLTGFRSDLDSYIPHLDLMVLSSFTEGMPNVILEAFAAGVPVVATAVGGVPELVEHGVSGYLVPPGNPTALADSILGALAHEPTRHAMGRRARSRVRTSFTFEANATSYRMLFDELQAHRHAAPKKRFATFLSSALGH